MFGIFSRRKSLIQSGILKGAEDVHSHYLYGVDDGFRKKELSLKALTYLEELGLKTLWLTPHIMEDVPNSTEKLRERFKELKQEYSGTIELNLAAEYMLDNEFASRLANNDLLLHSKDSVLVETSTWASPVDFWEVLEEIKGKGYFPLLAHPERYNYMRKDDYDRLLKSGIRLQMNLPSILGVYGSSVKARAEYLLEKNMYYCAGSDCHRLKALKYQLNSEYLKSSEIEKIEKLLHKNV